MPVIDGIFVPRTPLSPAEVHVDWAGTNTHVVTRRTMVEKAATPIAKRLAVLSAQQLGLTAVHVVDELADRLTRELEQTARFGAASVTRELDALRAHRAVTAGYVVPDAGRFAQIAARGLTAVMALMQRRAFEAARNVAEAIGHAVASAHFADRSTLDIALTASARALHLQVLELVGESLNLGRAAGALTSTSVPEFAMRSEQLDRNTCVPCDHFHGTIVTVGSLDFYAVLPPTGCLGGGRCRGVMVYGDGPRDVRAPELLAA